MSKKKPENKLKYHIKTKLQGVCVSMRLAVGLRRSCRWPKKKSVNRKKKILAQKSQDFVSRLSRVLVPRSVRFAPSRSLFLCVNRATVFELIILVPRARDPSGLHLGSRTLTVPNF